MAVTLNGLPLGEDETQLTYSYSAPRGEQVEPLGLPRIDLPDGSQLESTGGGAFDGTTNSGTRTFKLSPIPEDVETISVDLASFTTYTPGATSVEFPLGDLLDKVDLKEINEREELPLGVEFSIGSAQYRITSLLLDPESFTLVCKPVNDAASRTTLTAQPSSVRLTDDKSRTYSSFLVGAEWDPADNSGHVMTYQALYFNGLPGPDTTAFSLHLGEKREITAPFVFRVAIPQAHKGDWAHAGVCRTGDSSGRHSVFDNGGAASPALPKRVYWLLAGLRRITMVMPQPQHHPDEHLMHARAQNKAQDARGSQGGRRVSPPIILRGMPGDHRPDGPFHRRDRSRAVSGLGA